MRLCLLAMIATVLLAGTPGRAWADPASATTASQTHVDAPGTDAGARAGTSASAAADAPRAAAAAGEATAVPPDEPSLDFDLLGDPTTPPPPAADPTAVQARRLMLNVHQGLGIGLMSMTAGLCVVGQLSYNDRFGGGSTGRYEQPHAIIAYTTLGVFAVTALTALLAPVPFERDAASVDRSLLHKIGLFTATAAMAASGLLGWQTAGREGYSNQQTYAQAHLALGYIALGAMAGGVSALVF